ncbi:hypothetical protein Desdi_3341 [Desulfitobacterium dichloroeliminans LMG P-21439]|uniref:Uncharacterized protein n=1 Tax=Desulfitobacterium dichloroeliminans (strain LMG P-21439 / DCA1) TaxID=871963 RepID=L0FCJ5_DESDL|nr:hypothetical protein Desdi_3341 [Desulfitobacterium dichloroeliminans LMG P-21439]
MKALRYHIFAMLTLGELHPLVSVHYSIIMHGCGLESKHRGKKGSS